MKITLFHYLRFSRLERIGTLALILATTVLFTLPEILRRWRTPRRTDFAHFREEIAVFKDALDDPKPQAPAAELFAFDPNTASFDDLTALGLSEKVANIICNYRDKGGRFRTPQDFQKIWSLKAGDYQRLLPYIRIGQAGSDMPARGQKKPEAELFAFDPNTATEAELLRLGLPKRTVKSMLNFREKGGKFRRPEDLAKIYTLSEADFERIAQHARFPEWAAETRPAQYAGGIATNIAPKGSKGPIDINRAGAEAWMSLPGIGEARARQVINFREKLGGFLSVEQVAEVRGLPDSVFERIRPLLECPAGQPRRINLNTVSAEDLAAHPYISQKQASLIVSYRENNGPFAAVDDLGKIIALRDKVWIEKVRPYLAVD
jgi:competence ComEA-like helix-hairpin-helix protein